MKMKNEIKKFKEKNGFYHTLNFSSGISLHDFMPIIFVWMENIINY